MMWRKFRDYMQEPVEIRPNIGKFKVHDMVYYQFAPNLDMDEQKLDGLLEAMHSVLNDSVFKSVSSGQEVISLELHSENKRSTYVVGVPRSHEEFIVSRLRHTYRGSGLHPAEPVALCFLDDVALTLLTATRHPCFSFRQKDGEFTHHLLNAYDLIEDGETAWTQILFEPVHDDWQEQGREKYQAYLNGEELINGVGVGIVLAKGLKAISDIPRSIARDIIKEEEKPKLRVKELKASESKLHQKAFRVSIRVAVTGSEHRRNSLTMSIVNAFRVLNDDNHFKSSGTMLKLHVLAMMNQRRMPPLDGGTLLCFDEVRAFWSMPNKTTAGESLLAMSPEESGIDERLTRSGIKIGVTPTLAGTGRDVYIPVTDTDDGAKVRMWISSPGGGKSTQIEFLTNGAAKLGHGFAAYDAKDGVLFQRLLGTIGREHDERRFVILNYENEQRPPIFNFSALGAEGQSAGSMFVELFEILFHGQNLTTSKSFAVKCAHSVFSDPTATFLEFIMMMRDEDFRKRVIPGLRSRNPDLYLWWKQEFPKISSDELNRMCRPVMDRIENDVLYNQTMSRIVCGRGGKIAYYRWMEEGKMVLVNAPLGLFSESELRFVMALHNFASWNAVLSRRKITQTGARAKLFHLLFDEPQNYMDATPTIQTAIAKARAYSVSYNFFIQEAEQIIEKAPALWKCILGMSPALMVGAVSESTAKHLRAELGVSTEHILRLKELPYHWYYKGYADKAAMKPVIIRSLTPVDKLKPPVPLVDRRALVYQSAQTYGPQTATEIDQDISARNFKLSIDEYKKLLASYEKDDNAEEGVEWADSDEAEMPEKKLAKSVKSGLNKTVRG